MDIKTFNIVAPNLPAEIAILMRGPTGVGKSHLGKAVAKAKDLPFVDVRLSIMSEGDVGGYPDIEGMKESGIMTLGQGLSPLQAYQEDIVFLKGLFNQQAVDHPSPHLGRVPNLLSGAWVSSDQNVIRVGQSMDQRLAKTIGRHTAIPSLVLGIEPTEMRLEDGLSMLYGSCISWETDTKPAMKEIYPARVFDLLVGDGTGRPLDRSVLDQTRQDAQSVRSKLNPSDRVKLDQYLDSIRSIETRIERAASEESLEGWQPTLRTPSMQRPEKGVPQDIPRHMKLMADLMIMAFQMDLLKD